MPRPLARCGRKTATELLYARQAVVTACAANDLQAIDIVFIDFKDNEGLRTEAEQGAGFGFSGKQIIHPNQVRSRKRRSLHPHEAIEYAKRIVESFEVESKRGQGRIRARWENDRYAASQKRAKGFGQGKSRGKVVIYVILSVVHKLW